MIHEMALAQEWDHHNREATRELFLALAMSPMATMIIPDDPDKIHKKIRVEHILYNITRPSLSRKYAYQFLDDETPFPPVTLQEFRFQQMVFYIVIDGNHRVGAAAYLTEQLISAKIVSITDVSGFEFFLDEHKRVVVETDKPGQWKITTHVIETDLQRANFQTFFALRNYDLISRHMA